MSDASLRGIVHVKEETKTYGSNGFRKRLVVLEQNKGSFTNYIPVEFTNDGCDTIEDLNVGDEVEIAYRLSGRKWQRDPTSEVKYFLNAEALNFNLVGTKSTDAADSANDAFAEATTDEDEIPF